jgi:hypothetical protein
LSDRVDPYAQRFSENGIDFSVLSISQTKISRSSDLFGHRRKILRAIADLSSEAAAAASTPPPQPASTLAATTFAAEAAGERRFSR